MSWYRLLTLVALLATACSLAGEHEKSRPPVRPAADPPVRPQPPPPPGSVDAGPAPTAPARGPIELVFVGDVMFGRYKDAGLDRNPEQGFGAFDSVKGLVAADLAVANLETTLLRAPPVECPWDPRLRFVAGPWAVDQLADAGFRAVSLANNHAYDMRIAGARGTPALLREKGITPIGELGTDEPPLRAATVERDGWRIAFIAFTRYRNSIPLDETLKRLGFHEDEFYQIVRAARARMG